MAYAMTKRGSLDNSITYEFICDTTQDMNAIEDRYRTIGTVAIVLQGSGGLEVYITGSDKQWNSLSVISSGGSSPSDGAAGLSIHICGQNEVSNGLPNISVPDETTIYLVPAQNSSSGNLYEEYIYVDDDWEKFGSGNITIDLSDYATKSELPDVSGFYTKPSGGIPASDLADIYLTSHQDISGKVNSTDLATVATSGSYTDLSNTPTIPDIQINNSSIVSNGVASIPLATTNDYGLVKIGEGLEFTSSNNKLRIASAGSGTIKAGGSTTYPVVPAHQHEAVFYGLAKAAGVDMKNSENPVGTYTAEAQTAIQAMLGIVSASGVSF